MLLVRLVLPLPGALEDPPLPEPLDPGEEPVEEPPVLPAPELDEPGPLDPEPEPEVVEPEPELELEPVPDEDDG